MFRKILVATLIAASMLFTFQPSTQTQAQEMAATARFYEHRGQQRYADGKLKQAVADFDRAITMEPRNAALFNARGLTWLALKDFGMAIRDFNQAIKLAPDFAAAYANRGLTRFWQGKEAKANRDFAKCFELDNQLRTYVQNMKNQGNRELTARQ